MHIFQVCFGEFLGAAYIQERPLLAQVWYIT